MGTTTYLACDDCKETCWIGKSRHIYKYQYIPDWLHEHKNHKIRFVDEHDIDVNEELSKYTEYSEQDSEELQYLDEK